MFSPLRRSWRVGKLGLVSPVTRGRVDRAEWDRIIRAHDRRVFLSVLALGVRADRARDVVQATWTRLMEKDERGELTRENLAGLAVAQARFLALDELRRAGEELRHAEAPPERPDEVDAERLLLGRERLERAAVALASCPPSAQSLFKLIYAEPPRGYAQAAAELGLSLQRVRQLMCELRKKLRLAIEEGSS
jgi:RNA polymerase sigma-70 factor (ECF subfamily)